MPKPLRIEFAGALYHVISRGNERREIERNDGDREMRLEWLRRTVETCGWRLHAFVLITNHDHLCLEVPVMAARPEDDRWSSYAGYRRASRAPDGRAASRHEDATGAVAAYLARREFGYPAHEVAALG